MTTKEFISLEKSLLQDLEGFSIKGSLMFRSPVGRILQGVSFEGSSFDKTSFYVNVFAMPLCVPADHLFLNFGSRVRHVGGGDRWCITKPGVVAELTAMLKRNAIPFFSKTESLLDFAEVAKSFSGNPHTTKAIAFTLARAGKTSQAIELLSQLPNQVDFSIPWQREIGDLCMLLEAKLRQNPTDAQQQLAAWEVDTTRALGLELYRDRG